MMYHVIARAGKFGFPADMEAAFNSLDAAAGWLALKLKLTPAKKRKLVKERWIAIGKGVTGGGPGESYGPDYYAELIASDADEPCSETVLRQEEDAAHNKRKDASSI